MVKADKLKRFFLHPYFTLFSRVALGGVFIFAGIAKITSTNALILEIRQHNILPYSLASAYGRALPPVEIVLGAFLVLGIWQRISASLGGLLCLSFIIAKILEYAWGLDIFICYCFGPAIPLLSTYTLAVDFAMLILAIQIMLHQGEFLSLDALLLNKSKKMGRKIVYALIASLAAIATVALLLVFVVFPSS
jgi:uncharacterized membrane protein YphA (DoxX/SURF4 family)